VIKMADKIFLLRKNMLDLQYNKYLQFYTTTIMIAYTYIIAVAVGTFTNQIEVRDSFQL